MDNTQTSPDQDRERLLHAGTLHWFHWIAVCASLVLTVVAWHIASQQLDEKLQLQFNRQADHTVELVLERMRKYEDALWAGVAFLEVMPDRLDRDTWRDYARHISIEKKYPGINGIGVVLALDGEDVPAFEARQRALRPYFTIHPEHPGSARWPIVYIEPEASNRAAVGLDMAHERNRFQAAQRARDTGAAQITGPIVLVQDQEKTPGFLFFAPIYGAPHSATLAERQRDFIGAVYAPFVVKKLMRGVLAKDSRHVGIRIADGQTELYDEHMEGQQDFDPSPMFSTTRSVSLYGRTWVFDIRADLSFRAAAESNEPLLILVGGLFADGLLLLLFLGMSRANRAAIALADQMTDELAHKAERLQRSNDSLEHFAYAAAHDLKSPIRAITHLSAMLAEDLEDVLDDDARDALSLLQERADRMDELVDGLMAYARSGGKLACQPVALLTCLREVVADMTIPSGFVVALPSTDVCVLAEPVQLRRAFSNLINNAIQHHPRAHGRVVVSLSVDDERAEIQVADDGAGIDAAHHERIFALFQTLRRPGEAASTGLGLSLVKKIVEDHGGSVRVESALGEGSRFIVTWPRAESLPENPREHVPRVA